MQITEVVPTKNPEGVIAEKTGGIQGPQTAVMAWVRILHDYAEGDDRLDSRSV